MKLLLSQFADDSARSYASIINDHKQLCVEHSHDYFEIFVVNGGNAVHRVNGGTQRICKGSVALIRPDDVHSYSDMSPDFNIINMLIPSQTLFSLFEFLGKSFCAERLLSPKVPLVRQLSPDNYNIMVIQLEQLVLSKHVLRERSDAIYRATLASVILACFPLTPEKDRPDLPNWLRGLCLDMMKSKNITEGLPALWRLADKSPEYLSRMFRKHLHMTPTEFVNELRLDHAARAILSSKAKIIDICADAGFDNLSHFYHLFASKYSMSPSRYRAAATSTESPMSNLPVIDTGLPTGIPFLAARGKVRSADLPAANPHR